MSGLKRWINKKYIINCTLHANAITGTVDIINAINNMQLGKISKIQISRVFKHANIKKKLDK